MDKKGGQRTNANETDQSVGPSRYERRPAP